MGFQLQFPHSSVTSPSVRQPEPSRPLPCNIPCAGTARTVIFLVPVANRPCDGPTEALRTRQPCRAIVLRPCIHAGDARYKVLHRLDEVLKSLFLNNHYFHVCPIFVFGCKVTKEKGKLNHCTSLWLKVAVRWLKMAVGSRQKQVSQRKSFLSKHLLVKRVDWIPLILHP